MHYVYQVKVHNYDDEQMYILVTCVVSTGGGEAGGEGHVPPSPSPWIHPCIHVLLNSTCWLWQWMVFSSGVKLLSIGLDSVQWNP